MEAGCDRQCGPHDSPRLEPSLGDSVGRPHQRVAGRSHLLHAHQRAGARARRFAPTGGIRYFQASEFLEDVFTMNDFGFPLKAPNHPFYLNTEFVGHTFPTKTTDDDERQREHTLRHARIHNQLASDARYAGGIGGARSTTTPTRTSAPAIAFAITG